MKEEIIVAPTKVEVKPYIDGGKLVYITLSNGDDYMLIVHSDRIEIRSEGKAKWTKELVVKPLNSCEVTIKAI